MEGTEMTPEGLPPPRWGELIGAEDRDYLSRHLGDELLRDLLIVLGECPEEQQAKLVAEIRALLPDRDPHEALVVALARVTYDAEQDESSCGPESRNEPRRTRFGGARAN
jgi:hypothetical protein